MMTRNPAYENVREWLLRQVPFGVGLVTGSVLGVRFAPSPLLAAVSTLLCGLLGLGTGVALANWRTAERTTQSRS